MTGTLCDLAAEMAVLGSMLDTPRAIDDVTRVLDPSDYYQPRNEQLHRLIVAEYDAGRPTDPTSILEATRRAELRGVDGVYLVELIGAVTVSAAASHWAGIVRRYADLRRVHEAGVRMQQMATEAATEDADRVLDEARRILDTGARDHGTIGTIADDLPALIDSFEAGVSGGADTPWPDLTSVLAGLQPGSVYVVAARPGVGKSLMAQALAVHVARRGRPVFWASVEMRRSEVWQRVVAAQTGVPLDALRKARLSEQHWDRVRVAEPILRSLPIVVDDAGTQTLTSIRRGARDTARRSGPLGLLVVDYLQITTPRDPRVARQEQVAEMSRGMKMLARELDVPVVLLSQLNRNPEARADKRPSLGDLRESGAIEADADVVILLHRPDDAEHALSAIVAKNRSGAQATVDLWLRGDICRIESAI